LISKFKRIHEDEQNVEFLNVLLPKIMIFVVICAKLLNLFLVPNYNLNGNKAFISVFHNKLKNFPLHINKNYGINSNKMALKYLHSDMVKVMKSLKINVPEESCLLNDLKDLSLLIEIMNKTYLNY